MSRNCVIKKAKEEFDYLTGDENLRRLAELREKALKDRNSLYNYGHRTGTEEGIKKGMEQGIKQGIKQVASVLINENYSIEMIMKITNLTEDEIKKIKDKTN